MNTLTPYLCVADARAAIRWYTSTLQAQVIVEPMTDVDGRIGHCELAVGDAHWMLSDEYPAAGITAPTPGHAASVSLHLVVTDIHAIVADIRETGTPIVRGPEQHPLGGRIAVFLDPFGHRWLLHHPSPQLTSTAQ